MFIFLSDNEIFIINKQKIINNKLKSISKGYIINKDEFINEFGKLLKKEKIKLKILASNIKIIKNSYFKKADLFYFENIFNELGFGKIEFLDIKELFNKEATYIEINNTYLVINDLGLYLDLNYYKDIPRIIEYFADLLNDKIILYGLNKIIPLIKLKNKEVFYVDNYLKFIPDSLLKVNK